LVSLALTRTDISSRSPDAARLMPSIVAVEGPLLSSGKVFSFSFASSSRLISVDGISIGTAKLTPPPPHFRPPSHFDADRQAGLGRAGHDPRLGLHAECQHDRRLVDARLRRECPRRAHFQPEVRRSRPGRAERDRAAHLRPLLPRRLLDEGTAAQPFLQRRNL